MARVKCAVAQSFALTLRAHFGNHPDLNPL
jgi:hypothetical protein